MAGRYDLTAEEYAQQEALADKLNADGLDPEDVDCESGEHPEGSKRGGHVAVHADSGARVFWNCTAEEWVPYDGSPA